ncbi:hypothetical protein MHYP_G00024990 [Metynnis hypsauchen]
MYNFHRADVSWEGLAYVRKFGHLSFTRLRLNKVVECHVLKDSLVKDVHLKREAIIKALCPHLNDDGFLI